MTARLLLATRNGKKLDELRRILQPRMPVEVLGLADVPGRVEHVRVGQRPVVRDRERQLRSCFRTGCVQELRSGLRRPPPRDMAETGGVMGQQPRHRHAGRGTGAAARPGQRADGDQQARGGEGNANRRLGRHIRGVGRPRREL